MTTRRNVNGGSSPDGNLLVTLGKIAGIGGIAVGTFFLLFHGTIPQLSPTATLAIIFLSYGVAVLGLMIWAFQATGSPVLAVLLAVVAVVLSVVAWKVIDPSGSGDYQVRITVLLPDGTPVPNSNEVRVLAGCGAADPSPVQGGWKLQISPNGQTGDRECEVWATYALRNLNGRTKLTLAGNHNIVEQIKLVPNASGAVIHGILLDENGLGVGGATVTVLNYANQTTTHVDGTFELPVEGNAPGAVDVRAQFGNKIAENTNWTLSNDVLKLRFSPSPGHVFGPPQSFVRTLNFPGPYSISRVNDEIVFNLTDPVTVPGKRAKTILKKLEITANVLAESDSPFAFDLDLIKSPDMVRRAHDGVGFPLFGDLNDNYVKANDLVHVAFTTDKGRSIHSGMPIHTVIDLESSNISNGELKLTPHDAITSVSGDLKFQLFLWTFWSGQHSIQLGNIVVKVYTEETPLAGG